MEMSLTCPQSEGYALIDSGEGRKLERFGEVLVDRPAPQAIWPKSLPTHWDKAQAVFERGEGGNGRWLRRDSRLPDSWLAAVEPAVFEIRLTGFGNVGLFPEHGCHWSWIADRLVQRPGAKVLNLFAYTGGASLAAAAAGAAVTHLDAAKAVNNWAQVNARLSQIEEERLRLITDDAIKFTRREIRRSRRYDGIILDPPTFGRGSKGEVWKIERDLHVLIELLANVLDKQPAFFLLTAHSPGLTPIVLGNMLASLGPGKVDVGEMVLAGNNTVALPAGSYARWTPECDG